MVKINTKQEHGKDGLNELISLTQERKQEDLKVGSFEWLELKGVFE